MNDPLLGFVAYIAISLAIGLVAIGLITVGVEVGEAVVKFFADIFATLAGAL